MRDVAEQIAERLWRDAPLATGGVCGLGQDQWKRVAADLIRNSPGFAEALEDSALLDWWEAHLNYEHGTDYESGEVVLYRVSGNVNDRVWDEKARAATLRDAIRAASEQAQREAVQAAGPPQKTLTKAEFIAALTELPDFTVEWSHTGNIMGQIMTAKFLLKKAI